MTSFDQFQHAVEVALRERSGVRKGRAYFDVLLELEPELANRLAETDDDPFYDDDKLPAFLSRVAHELP
jgi:hypothetical protein